MNVAELGVYFKNSLYTFTQEVIKKLNEKPPLVEKSDDAMMVGNQTPETILHLAEDEVNSHAQLMGNPHRLTSAKLGMYPKSYITDKLKRALPAENIPLSNYGAWTNPMRYNLPVTVLDGVVTIKGDQPLFLNGRSYITRDLSVDCKTLHSGYKGARVNLIIGVDDDGGKPYLQITSAIVSTETKYKMYIGYVDFNDNGDSTGWNIQKVFRTGVYRISTTPGRNTISVSSGRPTQPSKLEWK